MTVPACDDCGHPSDIHTVEHGCAKCDCPSLLVISDHEAEAHFARLSHYQEWMRRLGPRWRRRSRKHHTTKVSFK